VNTQSELLTLGLAAVRIGGGVQHHHLDRLAQRGAIPFRRAGRLRLVEAHDLEVVREACERAGYFRPATEVPVHA
jgi:hypothetical protein